MPIYAYKCDSCGHAKDVLQKMSDPKLTVCPACGAEAFTKQVTAAGFQLKGSGWYVTDFRGDNSAKGAADAPSGDASTDAKTDTKSESKSETKSEAKSEAATPATSAPAPKKEAASASTPSAGASSSPSSSSSSS